MLRSNYTQKVDMTFRIQVSVLTDLDALTRSRLLNQLRRGGLLSDHELRMYTGALSRGEIPRVIRWLRRKGVYIANPDYEHIVIDSNTEPEVARIVREHADAEFTQFKTLNINPPQVLADFKNQTINRIRQFRERLGLAAPLPGEGNAADLINTEFDRLFAEANAAGLPAAGGQPNLDLLRKFVKRDKPLWHTRIVRSIKSGFEPKDLTGIIRDVVARVVR